jgi:hypothetical protein
MTDSRSGRTLAVTVLAVAAVLVVSAGLGAASATTWYGDDSGGDGQVTFLDALMILHAAAGAISL